MNDTQLILNAIEAMGNRFDAFEGRFDTLENEVKALKTEAEIVKNETKEEVKTLKHNVRSINLTLETKIARNISVVAEGYAILDCKLDESLAVNQEKEMLLIRVNHFENEVRKLKEQISGIA